MTRYLRLTALIAAVVFICSCQVADAGMPVVPVELNGGQQLVTITNWRLCGPFRLPEGQQGYTDANLRAAFEHDYLTQLGGREIPFALPGPTTNRPVDFEHDPNDEPDLGPPEVQFIDQVQQFPTPSVNTQVLFWRAGEFFKITYASAVLWSDADTEAALVFSGNSPVRVWLNDKQLLQSPTSSVGHDPDVLHLLMAPLKKGRNTLLLKMFCFPKRNEFVVRVATRERALSFVREHGGLRDVVEEAVVPPGQPLRLSGNLPFFASGGTAEVGVEIAGRDGRIVLNGLFDAVNGPEVETRGLSPGLYKITASIGGWTFSENFYIGDREQIAAPYEGPCAAGGLGPPAECAALEPLREIATHARSAFRLDWQKRALFLIEQLEGGLAPPSAERFPARGPRGTRVFSYRSRIDGQVQHYFLYLPQSYDGRGVPLVVVSPHNTVQKPLLSGPLATNPDLLRKLATFADEYGYAYVCPFGRGRNNNVHLALADTLEALDDVQRRFVIDADRIYLTGDCGGARNALLFAQRFPDRVAALSVLNTAASSGVTANALWREGNAPRAAVENLLNIPLQLVHGDHFPHSPTQQSVALRDDCRRAGIDPELILIPGDGRWSEQDPLRISFAFFQGKVRQTPQAVALATGQLKYGSAYWVRVTELKTAPALGRVVARFEAPGKVVATASNVAEFELLPGRFPPGVPQSGALEVNVNGVPHAFNLKGDEPVKLRIVPAVEGGAVGKNAATEGPVSHAFAEPFLIVHATDGGLEEQTMARDLADQIESAWQDNYYVPCLRKSADEITPRDIATSNLVITGGPNVAGTLKRLFGPLPFELQADHVRVGNELIQGRHTLLSAIYPNPQSPGRYVVLVASNNTDAVKLPAPELARRGSYDVAVWQFERGERPRLFGEWYWDNSWSRLMWAGGIGRDANAVEDN